MPSSKEIKNQILGVRKIKKITSAMQNVAASKMRRAKTRMTTSMPYAEKIQEVVSHIAASHHDYQHPYLQEHQQVKKVGYIVVATDRGLCGGLNLNLFKLALEHASKFHSEGIEVDWCLFGKKAEVFFRNIAANVVAQVANFGDEPRVVDLLGGTKVMLDAYDSGNLDRLFIVHNKFITTIKQKPQVVQLLPIVKLLSRVSNKSYLYEPEPKVLLDTLMQRYLEAEVYQAVVDNLACEQVARMVAMQSATDNSQEIIENLQLTYNKVRQAAITREIAEIVGGADAV